MHGRAAKSAAIMMAALVLLVVFGVSAMPGTRAVSAPVPSVTSTEWAYGVVKNISWGPHPLAGHPGWVWKGDATIGFSVILSQTNTSASTFELDLNWSMGVRWNVEYCLSSCDSPSEFLFNQYAQSEVVDASVNLTDQGTVIENGTTSVPAVALLNSTSHVVANLTNTARSSFPGPTGMGGGMMVSRSMGVNASVRSDSQVTFDPYLGLFPLDLSAAQVWSSNASFVGSGGTTASFSGFQMSSTGSGWTLGPGNANWSVASSGNVSLLGSYSPGDKVNFGGVNHPALRVGILSPFFAVREGFFVIPTHADLFGGSPESWSGNETGDASAAMATLDVTPRPAGGGHLGLVASSWRFTSNSLYSADEATAGGALLPAIASSDLVANQSLQAAPLTLDTARNYASCLAGGPGCPVGTNVLASKLRGLLFSIVVTAVVVAVVATLAIVLVSERRRLPPPAYPNAQLYPPGDAGAGPKEVPRTPGQRPGTPPTSPPDEDPLDHLW